ncbi:MAG: hypothetical protein LBM03_00820 [Erysipelotrichaceae bacterium]|nr:hypothetical protein [Erysipelotrichaceae bacterium]
MNKKILFMLPALLIGLAACSGQSDQAAVDEAASVGTLWLDWNGGPALDGKTYQIAYGNSLFGLNSYVTQSGSGKEVTIEWSSDTPDKVKLNDITRGNYAGRTKIGFKMGTAEGDEYTAVVTANLKCGNATAAVSFSAEVGISDIKETTIKDFKEGYKDAGYNTTLGEAVYTSADDVSMYGYITGSFEQNDSHLYSGVWIQAGEDAIQLYAAQLWNQWNSNGLAIGDFVHVVGFGSGYNGLLELKPTVVEVEVADPESLGVSAPSKISMDNGDNWNATWLLHKDSSLVEMNGLVYKSGEIGANGKHWTLKFEATTTSTTKVEVTIYVNYHIGATAQDAIRAKLGTLVAGTTTIDIKGIISWYNAPQIVPVFLDGLSPADCITVR